MKIKYATMILLVSLFALPVLGGNAQDCGLSCTDNNWKAINETIVPPCSVDVGITHWEVITSSNDDIGIIYDMMHGLGYVNLQGHYLQSGERFLSGDCQL